MSEYVGKRFRCLFPVPHSSKEESRCMYMGWTQGDVCVCLARPDEGCSEHRASYSKEYCDCGEKDCNPQIEINLPETIKVGGFDYEVDTSKRAQGELRSSNWAGSHSNMLQLIRLDTDATPQQLSDSFLHEILHAIDVVYNASSSNESTIVAFSHGLLQVMEQLSIRFVMPKVKP